MGEYGIFHPSCSITETDVLLMHLQSFTSNPIYFTVPEIVKKGMPLFYLPPNSNTPKVNLQLQQQASK